MARGDRGGSPGPLVTRTPSPPRSRSAALATHMGRGPWIPGLHTNRTHPKGTAPVLYAPSKVPSPGYVSHETYSILHWSPFRGQGERPDSNQSQDVPKKKRKAKRLAKKKEPEALPDFAATSPPPRLTPLMTPVPQQPLFPPSPMAHTWSGVDPSYLAALQEKEQKAEAEKRREAEQRAASERRRLELQRQRLREREGERMREAAWIQSKQIYALEAEAENSSRAIVITERRERERIGDLFRREEAELYFILQRKMELKEDQRRQAQRAELLRRERGLNFSVKAASLMSDEELDRDGIVLIEAQHRQDLEGIFRYIVAFHQAAWKQLSIQCEEEEEDRKVVLAQERHEIGRIVKIHKVVVAEYNRLLDLENAEFAQRIRDLAHYEDEERSVLESTENLGYRDLLEAFTHGLETVVWELQRRQHSKTNVIEAVVMEERMNERVLELEEEMEDGKFEFAAEERRFRKQLEHFFYIKADAITVNQARASTMALEEAEVAERREWLIAEDHGWRHLIRLKLIEVNESGNRVEISEAEAYAYNQITQMHNLTLRLELGMERERRQEDRLRRLEQVDRQLADSSLERINDNAAAVAIQAQYRQYMAAQQAEAQRRAHQKEAELEQQAGGGGKPAPSVRKGKGPVREAPDNDPPPSRPLQGASPQPHAKGMNTSPPPPAFHPPQLSMPMVPPGQQLTQEQASQLTHLLQMAQRSPYPPNGYGQPGPGWGGEGYSAPLPYYGPPGGAGSPQMMGGQGYPSGSNDQGYNEGEGGGASGQKWV